VFGYGLGSNLDNGSGQGYNISTYLATFNANGAANPPYSASPSGNLYVPNDNDFENAYHGLAERYRPMELALEHIAVYLQPDRHVADSASFDDFVWVMLSDPTALLTPAFVPIPYWTGYYMSRPGLKALHYNATRYLLGR
jgi:alpha-mannosidase